MNLSWSIEEATSIPKLINQIKEIIMDLCLVEEKAAKATRDVALYVCSVAIEGGLKGMADYLIIQNNYSFDAAANLIGIHPKELAWHLKNHYGIEYNPREE